MEINTKQFVEEWKLRLKKDIKTFETKPKLKILIAKDYSEPSKIYVNNKLKVANEIGIECDLVEIEWKGKTKEELKAIIFEHCMICEVDKSSIIIQVPFPLLSESEIGEILNKFYKLDVDGFSPMQRGFIASNDKLTLPPCTAKGVIELLKYVHGGLIGKNIAIFSRSKLIGLPLVQLAIQNDMSIKVIHSKSNPFDSQKAMWNSDIVVTGCGKRKIFNSLDLGSRVKTVIDCSMDKVEGVNGVGDFNKEDVLEERPNINMASGYGHTGLVTVVALMDNVVKSHKIQNRLSRRIYNEQSR